MKQSADSGHTLNLAFTHAEFADVLARMEAINGVQAVERMPSENGNLLAVKLTCAPASDLREAVYRQIKETDWLLMEFRQETRTLENIFRELTREN